MNDCPPQGIGQKSSPTNPFRFRMVVDIVELVKRFKISNKLGLHARAAASIVKLAGHYESRLFLSKDDQEVDGTSILSILTLSCPRGTEVQARVVGEDSKDLMKELSKLFKQKFGERE